VNRVAFGRLNIISSREVTRGESIAVESSWSIEKDLNLEEGLVKFLAQFMYQSEMTKKEGRITQNL
jgi:hypothetical protein